ncbi:ABC transporter substrate-binding protein [Diplocloster hominis]|uniref:ABC transporter substrate-binding protein n=1 Tax=Diplocloster hominis TaxID=3079010 RepID=UPI0031BA9899
MKRKLMALLMAAAMTMTALTGCAGSQSAETENKTAGDSAKEENAGETQTKEGEMPNLVVTYAYLEVPTDIDAVSEKLNEITKEKLGCTVTFIPYTYGNIQDQMALTLASPSEQVDCMFGMFRSGIAGAVGKGQLKALDSLLDEHGQDIKSTLGDYLEGTTVNGEVYGVTTVRDLAGQSAYYFDKAIIDELNIDLSTVHKYEDLTPVFAKIKEAYPNLYLACNSGVKPEGYYMSDDGIQDPLTDKLGVLMDSSKLTVSNLFESAEYKDFCKMMKEWNDAGYVYPDIITDEANGGQALMKSGVVASYQNVYKPGALTENELLAGRELEVAVLGEPISYTSKVQNWCWVIPENSVYPELAMQFLNLLYTDADLINLLNYGVEGKNWVLDADGFATDGPDTEGYSDKTAWKSGNAMLSAVWKGDEATLYTDLMDWNKSANKSAALGFAFDSANVTSEYTALTSVTAQYRMMIEWGFAADVDASIAEMNEALYAAGLKEYMEEKQNQLDAWAAAK